MPNAGGQGLGLGRIVELPGGQARTEGKNSAPNPLSNYDGITVRDLYAGGTRAVHGRYIGCTRDVQWRYAARTFLERRLENTTWHVGTVPAASGGER